MQTVIDYKDEAAVFAMIGMIFFAVLVVLFQPIIDLWAFIFDFVKLEITNIRIFTYILTILFILPLPILGIYVYGVYGKRNFFYFFIAIHFLHQVLSGHNYLFLLVKMIVESIIKWSFESVS